MNREIKIDKTINTYIVMNEDTGDLQLELYDDSGDSDTLLTETIDFSEVLDTAIEWNLIGDDHINTKTKKILSRAADTMLNKLTVAVKQFKDKLNEY